MTAFGPELISSVGFPIAVAIGLYKLYREERNDRQEERQELRQERKKFREAIDGQTEAFRALARRIDGDEQLYLSDGGERADSPE